jgi:hypothetical protein
MALFPLGILSAAAGGVAFESDYDLLQTQILGSNQASVTFGSLGTYSSTYKHLQMRIVHSNTVSINWNLIQVNGDTTSSNYFSHELRGNGSNVNSYFNNASAHLYYEIGGLGWGSSVMDILDPYSTTKNKTFRTLTGTVGADGVQLTSSAYGSTTAISSLVFSCAGSSLFASGSRFSLYGIKG